jgi:tRNA A-37 threonylcarbamoyl transferase component Bud32
LACFDGARFFFASEYGFPDTPVTSIAEDDEGGIWTGSSVGLHRFWKGQVLAVHEGVVPGVIYVAPGVMIAEIGPPGTGLPSPAPVFLIRKEGTAWKTEALPGVTGYPTLANGSIVIAPGDNFTKEWFEILPSDVAEWKPGQNLKITARPQPYIRGQQIFRDRFGCVWRRHMGATGYQCATDAEVHVLPPTIAEGQLIMTETLDGRLLLPSVNSIALGRPGSFQVARLSHGLPPVEAALMTADGAIWIGGSKGLFRFAHPFRLEYWTGREGLTGPTSTLRIGDRVFAADGDGIKVLTQDRASWSILPKLPNLGRVNHIIAGPGPSIYAALINHGPEQVALDGSPIHKAQLLARGMHLVKTGDGQLWASGIGVTRIQLANGRAAIQEEPLSGRHWEGLDLEVNPKNGDLWACYEEGLTRKETLGWPVISVKDGLLENRCRSIAVAPSGDVWYGYNQVHAFTRVRLRPGAPPELKHFRSGGTVGDAFNAFLDFDFRNWFWRGANDGIYVAYEQDAEAGRWVHLTASDGLPGEVAAEQSFYPDPDGSVWFGLDTALVHFTPPPDLLNSKPEPVFLSALSWDGTPPRLASAVDHLPHASQVIAHLGTLQQDRRESIRIRYRLLPKQPDWSESSNLDLPLGSLGWGTYTLDIQGRIGSDGPWSERASYRIAVLRPAWLDPPIIGGLVLLSGIGIGGLQSWRQKKKRREGKAFPDLTELRMTALGPQSRELVGATLDSRFTVGKELASGGFAAVFEGWDLDQNMKCAIKIFHHEIVDASMANRFRQEVAALETIVHPNVVRLIGHGSTPLDVPYLVMEFIEGTTLRDALPIGGFEPTKVASLLRQIGSALDAIHRLGIYHRDLKPENLMLRSVSAADEELVLIDFSIAIVQSPDESMHGISRAAGTFEYMAPEQAVGFVDSTSDIYSLAKTVIELLTGSRLSTLLPKAARDLPERVREVLAALPYKLSSTSVELIIAALRFDPGGRPSNASEFAGQIAADLESAPLA